MCQRPISSAKQTYVVPANSKYVFQMCNAVIFINIFNIFPQIYMADLLHMLLSHIFIILGKICYTHIFWTIRQIYVSSICYCIFIICGKKSGACICLLSILPFMDMQMWDIPESYVATTYLTTNFTFAEGFGFITY